MNIPKDPFILLSFVNTKLRDEFSSPDKLCEELSIDKEELISKLNSIGYRYDESRNAFV